MALPIQYYPEVANLANKNKLFIVIAPTIYFPIGINLNIEGDGFIDTIHFLKNRNLRKIALACSYRMDSVIHWHYVQIFMKAMLAAKLPIIPGGICDIETLNEYGDFIIQNVDVVFCTNRHLREKIKFLYHKNRKKIKRAPLIISTNDPVPPQSGMLQMTIDYKHFANQLYDIISHPGKYKPGENIRMPVLQAPDYQIFSRVLAKEHSDL